MIGDEGACIAYIRLTQYIDKFVFFDEIQEICSFHLEQVSFQIAVEFHRSKL